MDWRKLNNSLSSSLFQKLLDGFRVYHSYMRFNWLNSLYLLTCLSLNFLKIKMLEKLLIFIFPIFIFFLNKFFIRKKLIPNFSGSIHQGFFNNKSVPLSGGIFLGIIMIYIFRNEPIILILSLFLIFLIGFFSDINFLSSVRWRFIFQSIIVFYFIFFHRG